MYTDSKKYKLALTSRHHKDRYFVKESYINWLKDDFILEIVLPDNSSLYEDIANNCDALIILGGDDVHPSLYDNTLHFYTCLEDNIIEKMDFKLIDCFFNKNKPIIGICRGIQVINVYFNGTLIQHIPDYKTVINHSKDIHKVIIDKNSLLQKYFPLSLIVNSYHHQCIKNVTKPFKVTAISEDGFIEAIEYNNIIGVQWHPEKMDEVHQKNFILLIKDLIKEK